MDIRLLKPDEAKLFKYLRLYGLQESSVEFGSTFEEEEDMLLEDITENIGKDETDPNFIFGAFGEDDELVGVTCLYHEERVKCCHKGLIWGIYVLPEFRGKGVGRSLLEAAINHARSIPNLRQINLSIVVDNDSARQLYESLGFEVYGREKDAFCVDDLYHDLEYMVLRL